MSESILPSPINPTGAPAQDKAALAKSRHELADTAEWLERLAKSEDFQRFIVFVKQGAKSSLAKGSDIDSRAPEKRDAYMQRFSGLNAMAEWPEEQLTAAKLQLRAMDEKLREL